MGPSGSGLSFYVDYDLQFYQGKTTLMNVVMGKVKKTEGIIYINDEQVDGLSKLRKLIGYVPQEDIMLRKLTVYDILKHSARSRLPVDWPESRKIEKVQEVIDFLDMGHVMHSIIGDEEERGISGGQRKRVNIGMELVAEPSILFLGETRVSFFLTFKQTNQPVALTPLLALK